MEQFRRVANFYFLLILGVQLIPDVSPFPIWTTVLPIVVILGIAAIKEAIEDVARHKEDAIANGLVFRRVVPSNEVHERASVELNGRVSSDHRKNSSALESQDEASATIDREKNIEIIKSKDIRVGDILRVTEGELLPADVIVLASSRADGSCYLNTANFDGETAPKIRRSLNATRLLKQPEEFSQLRCSVIADLPNPSLEHFQASASVHSGVDKSDLKLSKTSSQATAACKSDVLVTDLASGEESVVPQVVKGHTNGSSGAYSRSPPPPKEPEPLVNGRYPLGDENFLFRATKLVNTDCIYCFVVYTGHDSKLMQNRTEVPFKFSNFERLLNKCVIWTLVFNLVVCGLAACLAIPGFPYVEDAWPFELLERSNDSVATLFDFFTFFVLFSFMIPQSLYVTIEFVKVWQARLVDWDLEMTYVQNDEDDPNAKLEFARARTSNLHEELGQVSHIFTDKTGTLTSNNMELSQLSVGGLFFFNTRLSKSAGRIQNIPDDRNVSTMIRGILHDITGDDKYSTVVHDKTDEEKSATSAAHTSQQFAQRELAYSILCCHSILPTHDSDGEIEYQASSPDEAALLEGMAVNGLRLLSRDGDSLSMEFVDLVEQAPALQRSVKILAVLDFSSARQHMSVVVQHEDESIFIYTKGADVSVFPMCDLESDAAVCEVTRKHMTEYAHAGSRTLVFSCKAITQDAYDTWIERFLSASNSLTDRSGKIERAFGELETDMTLLGCSAVDDQLQRGVPEAVDKLLEARIKIMMLTGDKKETAVTIGYSSHIVKPGFKLLDLDVSHPSEVRPALEKLLAQCGSKSNAPSTHSANTLANADSLSSPRKSKRESSHSGDHEIDVSASRTATASKVTPLALVVDGSSLEMCLVTERDLFVKLFQKMETIICCRTSPNQKAAVVETVKAETKREAVTLAIGDGANDVSMIQSANVGIGILGKEGTQAATSSDYVIHRFRHLPRLLFVHGRFAYLRSAQLVLFSFFKNTAFPFTPFWFAVFSHYTGQTLYDGFLLTFFNIGFTALPPLFVGFFEKDTSVWSLMKHPFAYHMFKKERVFSGRLFMFWMAQGMYFSVVLFFLPYGTWYGTDAFFTNGQVGGLWLFGVIIITVGMFVVNAKMFLEVREWVWSQVFGALFGFLAFMIFFAIYQELDTISPDMFKQLTRISQAPISYFLFFITVAVALIPGVLHNYYNRRYNASYSTVLRQCCQDSDLSHKCHTDHVSEFLDPNTSPPRRRSTLSPADDLRHRHRTGSFHATLVVEPVGTTTSMQVDDVE